MGKTKSSFHLILLLLVLPNSLCFAQKRKKTLADFEKEYVERVYIKSDERLKMEPFVDASSILLYKCTPIPNLPTDTSAYGFSYDNLVRQRIETASDSTILETSNIIEISDILINGKNVETAYKMAEEAYNHYLTYPNDIFGYATGGSWDYPERIYLTKPSHLFVFYNDKKQMINYVGFNFNSSGNNSFSKNRIDSIDQMTINFLKHYLDRNQLIKL